MSLHGEAATSEWKVVSAVADDNSATLVMEVTLPVYSLHFRREISLPSDAFTASITETVTNPQRHRRPTVNGCSMQFSVSRSSQTAMLLSSVDLQSAECDGAYGLWRGHEVLENDVSNTVGPYAQSVDGVEAINLSQPFVRDGTGFVAALLLDSDRDKAFVAVHNRRLQLVAGYCFDPKFFPWIVLWEENRAREYDPWNKRTRARGIEFGTSPMPLWTRSRSREMGRLFDTPVLCSIPASASLQTQYDLFLHPVPPQWSQIKDVRKTEHTLVVQGDHDERMTLQRGKRRR